MRNPFLLIALLFSLVLSACSNPDSDQNTTSGTINVHDFVPDFLPHEVENPEVLPRERAYTFPCPAAPGEWSNCAIDRRVADGYSIPEMPPLEEGQQTPDAEPWMQAALGNLAGGKRDGMVFTEFPATMLTQSGGANPAYLCVNDDGVYDSCPAELNLPHVPDQVTALALEYINGDDKPDLLIVSIEGMDENYMSMVAGLYPDKIRAGLKLYFYSQEWDEEDMFPHWVDKTEDVGLSDAIPLPCIPMNVQFADLNRDLVPEVVFGGYACPPTVFTWENERLVYEPDWLPPDIDTNAGVFTAPREDGTQNLFLVAYDGSERNDPENGGTSCWRGDIMNWTQVSCPGLGGSPMGFTLFDSNKDGVLEVASSDVGSDDVCTASRVAGPTESVACFGSSWMLPESMQTLAGPTRHNVSWAVNAFEDYVVYIEGYEHAYEEVRDLEHAVPWTQWPQQLHLYRFSDNGETWERVHDDALDANVQERGLIGPVDINGDSCVDLVPLPVGLTDMRALINGTCAAGTQEVAFRNGPYGAYGSMVLMIAGETRQATVISSSGGTAGFSPPVKSIPPHVTSLEVHWTNGDVTTVERDHEGHFPSLISL